MKTSLQNVLTSLREANGPTRFVVGMAMVLILGVAGVSWYRSANPHMVFFRGDLESSEFSRVTSALGAKGIRFETSSARAPYSVWVESGRKHEAWNAVAIEGALDPGTRGIDTAGGTSAPTPATGRRSRSSSRSSHGSRAPRSRPRSRARRSWAAPSCRPCRSWSRPAA